jgi:hypothetical protein
VIAGVGDPVILCGAGTPGYGCRIYGEGMFKKEAFHKIADLFLISFLALYFEVMLIRWIPSSIQLVAYFTNIILISSFLGLGLGCLLTGARGSLMQAFPLLLLAMSGVVLRVSPVIIKSNALTGEYFLSRHFSKGVDALLIVSIIMVLNMLLFIPLGQHLGRCLKSLRPLVGYSINIAGSIAGVIVFSLMSYLMLAPVHWFLFGAALALWFYIKSRKQLVVQGLILIITLLTVTHINTDSLWSPNYKIDVYSCFRTPRKIVGLLISANNMHHQFAFDLSEEALRQAPLLNRFKQIYELPYRFINPRNVLVLGAGSGNDVAAALRMGVKEVSAVEIDPCIAIVGRLMHPEKPYDSGNTSLFIDDARSFVKKSRKKFDLIAFGYLDAHKVLSQFSSVRLDNFIYTVESFRDIKGHLSEKGMVSLTYLVFKEWIGDKLYAALKEVFGNDVLVLRGGTYHDNDTAIFLAGPAVRSIAEVRDPAFKVYDGFDEHARYITDDWPYLYLPAKGIPFHYIVILSLILIVSFLSVAATGGASLKRFNAHFFFLGAGFMLLETVGITRFALLFGSTWIVNSAVIVSILIMVLLANVYVSRAGGIRWRVFYVLLIASIFLNWLLKPEVYLLFNKAAGISISSFVLALPMLFASIIFAASFRESKDIPGAFAYNMLGAILGGSFEYISMVSGFNSLFLLAIGIYCLSYLSKSREAGKNPA